MRCFINVLKKEKILDPQYGDFKLQLMPFDLSYNLTLPKGFELWQSQVNDLIKLIPIQENANTHYLTIDSKFFSDDGYLRREGLHVDGNFCVDPDFVVNNRPGLTWHDSIILDDKIKVKFASQFNIVIPKGKFISGYKGGIICASSYAGCHAWEGEISDIVGDGGSYSEKYVSHAKKISLEANKIYFMSSNTPHETTLIPKGTRRTLIRISLNHEYDNSVFEREYDIKLMTRAS